MKMADPEVTCPCGKQFKRKATYDRHMEIVHSETISHKCKTCGKTFGNSNTLTMHMSVHETKQNFAKLVRTRKSAKNALDNSSTEEKSNKLNTSRESEDSSSEKENNTECQSSPAKAIVASLLDGNSLGVNKPEHELNVLSEKSAENSAKKVDHITAPVPVKSALPSLKEIIDSQTTTTNGLPKVLSNSPPESVTLNKSSTSYNCTNSKDINPLGLEVAKTSVVGTSKCVSVASSVQCLDRRPDDKGSGPVISGSSHVGKVNEPNPSVPCSSQESCKVDPLVQQSIVIPAVTVNPSVGAAVISEMRSPAEVNPATVPPAPQIIPPAILYPQMPHPDQALQIAPAGTLVQKVVTSVPTCLQSQQEMTPSAACPATAALLSMPSPYNMHPPSTSTHSNIVPPKGLTQNAILPTTSMENTVSHIAAPLQHPDDGVLQNIVLPDESDEDKLDEEDLEFITDEDLEELSDEMEEFIETMDENGRKDIRKSKRRRSENPIWKSLLTGKVYEEILNNLEGGGPSNAKRARRASEHDASHELTPEELEDLPVKVEAIPQLECIKSEPFDPDFPDLDQLEAASYESPMDPAVSGLDIQKRENSGISSAMSKRAYHPGMSDRSQRGNKHQSFECFVCGKCFNSEKYLTMHISLHGTVENANQLLANKEQKGNIKEERSVKGQRSQVNGVEIEPVSKVSAGVAVTQQHQQLSQQVAALEQQSQHLQQQSQHLQQQLHQHSAQQKTNVNNPAATGSNNNSNNKPGVKKSPTAINRIVSEGGGWSCTLCQKSFAHNSGYKNHMRTHSNERPYVCTICDIGFKEKYHLKKHNLFIHSTELPEKCRFCGKRFKDSTAVRAHERIHSDDRPFACRRCTKTFKTSECLWHHEHRSKTCGQALGDIIAKERAQRKRRKFPKSEPGGLESFKTLEAKVRIKQEPGTYENSPCMSRNQNNMASTEAAINAANAAIERNVQAIMIEEQLKLNAKENQSQQELNRDLYMRIPEVVIKKEQETNSPPPCSMQSQGVPHNNGMIPQVAGNKAVPPQNGTTPPNQSATPHPNQTVINMLSQPPRPVQPPRQGSVYSNYPMAQHVMQTPIVPQVHPDAHHVQSQAPIQPQQIPNQQAQTQIQGRPVQHVQPQQSGVANTGSSSMTLPVQLPRQMPLQPPHPQVVLPQQVQKQAVAPLPGTFPSDATQGIAVSRPQPPQAVVQPQPRQVQAPAAPRRQSAGSLPTEQHPLQHLQSQQDESSIQKDDGLTCKLCNKQFKDAQSFSRHSKIHTEERPFICDKCDIGFKMKVL